MTDKLNNNPTEPIKFATNDGQVDSCGKCKKNPCVCSFRGSSENETSNGQLKKIQRPKISWI